MKIDLTGVEAARLLTALVDHRKNQAAAMERFIDACAASGNDLFFTEANFGLDVIDELIARLERWPSHELRL